MSRDGDEFPWYNISKQIPEVQQIQANLLENNPNLPLDRIPDVRSLAVVMGSTPR